MERTNRNGQGCVPSAAEAAQDPREPSFLARWSQRKFAHGEEDEGEETAPPAVAEPAETPVREITDADLPPLDSLDESSDYSMFLAEKVSAELRRLALRKLFRSEAFQARCPLNEYMEDYSGYTGLGGIVTYDMRRAMERAMEKLQATEAQGKPPKAADAAGKGQTSPSDDATARASVAQAEAGRKQAAEPDGSGSDA